MELYQIQCIKKIAEYQNMSQAALALNTSQPSLSRTLRNIESELELTLFDRIGKNLFSMKTESNSVSMQTKFWIFMIICLQN